MLGGDLLDGVLDKIHQGGVLGNRGKGGLKILPSRGLEFPTKFPAERRFFMQDYEQMHAKTNCCDSGGNREQVSVSGAPRKNHL